MHDDEPWQTGGEGVIPYLNTPGGYSAAILFGGFSS
jgi:hypothetical protein